MVPSKRIPIQETEAEIQAKAEEWLAWERIPFLHLPEAMFRTIYANQSVSHKVKGQLSGYLKGWADLIIFDPCQSGLDNRCLMIEIKRKREGRLSQGQKRNHEKVNVQICYTLEEIKSTVKEWIKRA